MKWTKEMPQAEGLYWIRTAQGDSAGTVHIVKGKEGFMCAEYPKRDAKDTGAICAGTCWGGYFWTEALPACPPFEI